MVKSEKGVWLTLEVAGCGDIEPISDPIAPQSFGLSLAPARNNDIIVCYPTGHPFYSLFCYGNMSTRVKKVLSVPIVENV